MRPDEKRCPDCDEPIRAAARVCRYCGYRFAESPGDNPLPRLLRFEVADLLASLTEKCLAVLDPASGRYRLLETVRQYARERRLASGESEGARDRHLEWFVALAENAEPELTGADQQLWLERLEIEHDNVRAALEWSMEAGRMESGLRLAGSVGRFWETHGHFGEGRARLARLLASGSEGLAEAARAKALRGAGLLAFRQGDYGACGPLLEQSLAICRESGDRCGIANVLNNLGNVAHSQGDYGSARSHYEQSLSLFRELGDRPGIADSLTNLGIVAFQEGENGSARSLYEQGLALRRELGDLRGIAISLNNLGIVAFEEGDDGLARSLYEQGLAIRRELGDLRGIALSLTNLGTVASVESDYASARSHYEQSLSIFRELGDRWGIANALDNLGNAAFEQGDYESARSLIAQSLSTFRELGNRRGVANALNCAALVAYDEGDRDSARSLLEESLTIFRELGDQRGIGNVLEGLAPLEAAGNRADRAAALWGMAERLRQETRSPLTRNEQARHDRLVAAVRAAMGDDDAFARCWEEGRRMTPEDAAALLPASS